LRKANPEWVECPTTEVLAIDPLSVKLGGAAPVPKYTDPDSPRRLLEEARDRCIEKAGAEYKTALLFVVYGLSDFEHFKSRTLCSGSIWMTYAQKLIEADAETICHAIILALGGNWSEVIGA